MGLQQKSLDLAALEAMVLFDEGGVERPGSKAVLAQIEYFSKGTVLARMVKCGRPKCPCGVNPKKRHGPYFEWTYKEQGKTVNVRLTPEAAPIFQNAAKQYRKLKSNQQTRQRG